MLEIPTGTSRPTMSPGAAASPTREQVLALGETAWTPAANQDGERREGAWVTELTGLVNIDSWPAGTRLICRRERPHPGAQLTFTDMDGHRFQCFITYQPDPDIAALEALHRQHAEVEDRVKTLKTTGAGHLPFCSFAANAAWSRHARAHATSRFTLPENTPRIVQPASSRHSRTHRRDPSTATTAITDALHLRTRRNSS